MMTTIIHNDDYYQFTYMMGCLMLDIPDTVYNHLLCMADDAGMSVESYILQMAVYGCIESDDKMNNTPEEKNTL